MFDKLKDMYAMRKEAQEMQAVLGAERATGTSRDGSVRITMTGGFDIVEVLVAEGAALTKERVERAVKEAFVDAQQKIKGILMQKFKGMG